MYLLGLPGDIQKHALIIGNEQYSVRENRLTNSVKYAKELNNTLEEINFNTKLYENVTQEDKIMQHVKNFTKEFMNGDIVLFYYSGQAQQLNNINYLILINDREINSEEDIQTFGINIQRILDRLTEDKPTSVFVFILDCCRPYIISNRSVQSRKFDFIGDYTNNILIFIIYSCTKWFTCDECT